MSEFDCVIRATIPGVDAIEVSKIDPFNRRFDWWSFFRIVEGVDGLGGGSSEELRVASYELRVHRWVNFFEIGEEELE